MDFTREPIIETIITPKEGCKLVVRNSKNAGQEEYFVEAVEIVAFGHVHFFRSLERPKAFLVPVSDYEILEVREARMVLKNAGLDRSIKIGGGRDSNIKAAREPEKGEQTQEEETQRKEEIESSALSTGQGTTEVRIDKKRDRRRNFRKRRGRDEGPVDETEPKTPSLDEENISLEPPAATKESALEESLTGTPTFFSNLLQPPPTLISETIERYRKNDLFKGAFFLSEEEQYKPHDKVDDLLNEDEDELPILQEPEFVEEESHESLDSEKTESMEEIIEANEPPPLSTDAHVEFVDAQVESADANIEPAEANIEFADTQVESALPLFEEEERFDKNDEELT